MGLLKLLTFPISGPVVGAKWVIDTVLDEAERQYYDEAAIRQEMLSLEDRHQKGQLDDASFERAADALLERLLAARAYHQRANENE